MPRDRTNKKQKEKIVYALLIAAMALGVVLNYYPHLNYPFPLHVDEWYHIYMAEHISQTGNVPIHDIYMSRFNATDVERGYHIFLAFLYSAFNLSMTSWQYLPSIVLVVAMLSTFFFVRRFLGEKEAVLSAFLLALLPTNVTIGGPAFLIPVDLSLIFIPLALLFAFRLTKLKPIYNYAALFLIVTFMLYSHPPSAVVILTLVTIYAALELLRGDKERKMHGAALIATEAVSALASIPNYLEYLTLHYGTAGSLSFNFPIFVSQIPFVYGIIPTLFFVIGFYLLASKSKDNRVLSLIITSAFLIATIVLYANFQVNFLIPYQRVYVPLFLLMGVIASFGYVRALKIKWGRRRVGIAVLVVAIILSVVFAVSNDVNTPYYHIINNAQYQNFLWIKSNLPVNSTAILDPWLAKAFGPITGMKVYSVIPFGPSPAYNPLLNNTYAFLSGNCTNTQFLLENNITLVYAKSCSNANLTLVHNDTYVFKR